MSVRGLVFKERISFEARPKLRDEASLVDSTMYPYKNPPDYLSYIRGISVLSLTTKSLSTDRQRRRAS